MNKIRGALTACAILLVMAAATLQVKADGPPWFTVTDTSSGVFVAKTGPGIFFGINNLSTSAQPAGQCIVYDNGSTNAGKKLLEENGMGPGQYGTPGGQNGLAVANGVVLWCSIAPTEGINVEYL